MEKMEIEKELEKFGLSKESYLAACKDIDAKLEGKLDIDWCEIKDKYNIQCSADTIRKASTTIFGGHYRKKLEDTPENNIDEKIAELREERIKLQTVNLENSRLDRAEYRQKLYYEYIGKANTTLPLPEFKEIAENYSETSEINYLLTIADIHYGATFKSINNEYSPIIAQERFRDLYLNMVSFIRNHQVHTLHVASLGDLIQGILRMSDIKINDSSVVKAVVEVSRLIAHFLNTLSKYVNIEYYHVPFANHTQIRPLGSKASELPLEDMEYVIGNYIKDLLKDNMRITVHLANEGEQGISINIPGNNVYAMHGHQIKNLENSIKNLSSQKRDFIDYLILGHYHAGNVIPTGESVCSDTEVLVSPSFVGSDPYSDSLFKGSKASVKIYGFDEIYGHTETYKIILN